MWWFLSRFFSKKEHLRIQTYKIDKSYNDMSKLSDHITLKEAIKSNTANRLGIDNTPNDRQLKVMRYLAVNFFEVLRAGLGSSPIVINSFYRCEELNTKIGGSLTSDHMVALDTAAIVLDNDSIELQTGISNADIFYFIYDNLDYYKLIWEFGDENKPNWVHISYSIEDRKNKRKQTFVAKKVNNKTTYTTFKDPR